MTSQSKLCEILVPQTLSETIKPKTTAFKNLNNCSLQECNLQESNLQCLQENKSTHRLNNRTKERLKPK